MTTVVTKDGHKKKEIDEIRYAPLGNIGLAGLGLVEGAFYAFNSNSDMAGSAFFASFLNVATAVPSIIDICNHDSSPLAQNSYSFVANAVLSAFLPLSNEFQPIAYPTLTLALTPYVSRAEMIANPAEIAYNRIMDWRENRKKESDKTESDKTYGGLWI